MQGIMQTAYFSSDITKTSTHHHDCHQLLFIVEGEVEINVNGNKYTADSGNIIIFSRYENHSVKIISQKYKRYILRISPQFNGEQRKVFSLLSNRPVGFNSIFNIKHSVDEYEKIFAMIIKEHNSGDVLSEEMIQALINQLLIMLYRIFPKNEDYFEEQSLNLVLKLQREFETNYSLNYSLEELAKKYNLSISSLSHQFKKITGTSVMNYLLFCRIASAKNLLAKTDLNIGEITELCGFSDNSNFSRTFKKLNGVPPTEFRKSYKR